MKHLTTLACATAVAVAAFGALPAWSNDVVTDWGSVKPPPAPELKAVTVDPKTTALLVLDFMKGNCGQRPLCIASVPNVKKVLAEARAHNLPVFYTLVGQDPTPNGMIDQGLAPAAGDFRVAGSNGGDKFIGSNLEQGLKDKGIKTVIITGTSAQGAVASTANGAAQRGFKVVVPVDGMSSEDLYNEQYAAWHIYKGGPAALTNNATLTRSDLIKFGG
jgi:nicotinamidase-related amidase